MSFNGSGSFVINSSGQPVVSGTSISSSVFNALTADLATGLSTCITKDGQTTLTANIPMGGYKLTGLGLGTSLTDSARVDNANALNMVEGRLTLTTGVPVTTADVTAAETLYFTPYKGNRIALYDGTNWVMRTFTELSIDVPDVTGVHDVFAYDDSGTVTLEVLVWTNGTTRATALTTQNGVLVKTGATTRRYLGTFYSTTAGNGQIEDSISSRYLWNYYNRVQKRVAVGLAGSVPYNYTTATLRQANGNAANQFNYVCGYVEDVIQITGVNNVSNSSANVQAYVGLGLDVTNSATFTGYTDGFYTLAANVIQTIKAVQTAPPSLGVHYIALLEFSNATGTTSWAGTSGAGIRGYFVC